MRLSMASAQSPAGLSVLLLLRCMPTVCFTTQDLVKFSESGVRGLPSGLYVVYLKLYSSVDQICIATSRYSPAILPHVRVRDCPNVTRSVYCPQCRPIMRCEMLSYITLICSRQYSLHVRTRSMSNYSCSV